MGDKLQGDFPDGVSELWVGKHDKDDPSTPYAKYGAIHRTPAERVAYQEEDMLFDDYKNDNGRGYYEYIYDINARKRNNMQYLDIYGPPSFFNRPQYWYDVGGGKYEPAPFS